MNHKLSATIISFNEEQNIGRAITSLNFADEILVVDSLSTDRTVEIAKSMGAKVVLQKFLGHIEQKQLAVDLAQNKWILSIDADEEVSPELALEIKALLSADNVEAMGYIMNRRNFHTNVWVKHGGWYPDRKLRLFDKTHGKIAGTNPHDKVVVNGPCLRLKNDLYHYTFISLFQNMATNNSFSSISAQELFNKNIKFSLLKLIFGPLFTFIDRYFYKLGMLDGVLGYIIAIGAGYSVFMRNAKLRELWLEKKAKDKIKQNL